MRIDVITLFPELVKQVIEYGVVGRAAEKGLIRLECWNPRDYTFDKHRTIDDRPYGGGPGMLLKVQPLQDAIQAVREKNPHGSLIYLSPQGKRITQKMLARLSGEKSVILLCGRYEGIDERLIEQQVDEEWSIGDFVMSGGELAAMAVIDASVRLIPGTLGRQQSAQQDSFSEGLLDYPHYTRPQTINGVDVPSVLMQGNHQQIADWCKRQALGRTWLRRPDLLEAIELDEHQTALLQDFKDEFETSL